MTLTMEGMIIDHDKGQVINKECQTKNVTSTTRPPISESLNVNNESRDAITTKLREIRNKPQNILPSTKERDLIEKSVEHLVNNLMF